jgi:hypothetical protein
MAQPGPIQVGASVEGCAQEGKRYSRSEWGWQLAAISRRFQLSAEAASEQGMCLLFLESPSSHTDLLPPDAAATL